MNSILDYKGTAVNVSDEGKGLPVVLLHGYLESLEIWNPFSDQLKNTFRVIRIDLPGHGCSTVFSSVHTMEELAEAVKFVLDALFIERCLMIGHSMGGYVSLAFAEKYHERLLGLCLFHSHPFADTDEKRQDRDREIELVRSGKKELIINTNIPRGFANDNLQKFEPEIRRAKDIGMKLKSTGIIAMLEGMKRRPDRKTVLEGSVVPLLWILGKKDNHIDYGTMKSRVQLNDRSELFDLDNRVTWDL